MRSGNPLRAATGGIFFLFLALAFVVSSQISDHLFLPVLFVGFAFSALIGSLSTLNPRGAYGGIMGFIWCLGLAFCFLVGFWPWILVVLAVSMIVGVLARPIMAAIGGQQPQQPIYQPPPQAPYQPSYPPHE